MRVFKFGGASINSLERIHTLKEIVQANYDSPLLIVISAMGKTTNALEQVVHSFFNNQQEKAIALFSEIQKTHSSLADSLLTKSLNNCLLQLSDFYTEVLWLLHDKPVREFDYYYDQIVSSGELMSTCIISHFLNEQNILTNWIDVRDILKTDNHFRDAIVDWKKTEENIDEKISPLLKKNSTILTQGYIGSTLDNENTTLGREGSDFSAAIFANILNAESVTIWKDVEAVMSADPKQFPDAEILAELSYEEVIEMAYFGAQVIHPKTIKPLQNKKIPLYVKCFLNANLKGTIIHSVTGLTLPPIIVNKENQVLISFKSKDFSFITGKPMSKLLQTLEALNIKPNLIQTKAISLEICLDDKQETIEKLALNCSTDFDVIVEKNVNLLTIRHYNKPMAEKMIEGKKIILKQRTQENLQVLYSL
jgi:aspartate kinase